MAQSTSAYARTQGRLPEGLVYPELIHSSRSETLQQNTALFNEQSRGCIRLITQNSQGDFEQESFFKNVSNLINRRQVNASPDNPAVTASLIPASELVRVKINRRVGPVEHTLDFFRKLAMGGGVETGMTILGEQIAKAQQVDYVDSALTALVGAIVNVSGNYFDGGQTSPNQSLNTDYLVRGLAKMGDAANRIVCWVMHSAAYFALVRQQIVANIDGVSNFVVATASPVTLNRPVIVVDSPSLRVANQVSPQGLLEYITLGLTEDACTVQESEDDLIYSDVITGRENLAVRIQGENAFNVGLKGFRWNVSGGGINPTNAALGTGSNWVSVMDSGKDLAGIAIRSNSLG